MLRVGGVVLDFHSESADININYFFFPEIVLSPNSVENIGSVKGYIGVGKKLFNYLELNLCEFGVSAFFIKGTPPEI